MDQMERRGLEGTRWNGDGPEGTRLNREGPDGPEELMEWRSRDQVERRVTRWNGEGPGKKKRRDLKERRGTNWNGGA